MTFVTCEMVPSYPEYIYEQAMMRTLKRSAIPCERQDEYEIYYRDWLVGVQRLDIFVAGEGVVEGCLMVFPAAISDLGNMKPQNLRHWMASQQISLGILANFNDAELKPVFMKETTHTIVNNR